MADENRKNRIKELLKMSDYVPSILIETRKEGLEEGIKLLKESRDIEFIQKITHYSLSDIKKAAKLASINIKI